MEEIKGMSDHDARRYLMKHGYGLGEIDTILNAAPEVDPNAEMLAAEESAPAPKAEPKPEPVKAAPKPEPVKSAPKPEPVKSAPAPKPVAAPAPKAKK